MATQIQKNFETKLLEKLNNQTKIDSDYIEMVKYRSNNNLCITCEIFQTSKKMQIFHIHSPSSFSA